MWRGLTLIAGVTHPDENCSELFGTINLRKEYSITKCELLCNICIDSTFITKIVENKTNAENLQKASRKIYTNI